MIGEKVRCIDNLGFESILYINSIYVVTDILKRDHLNYYRLDGMKTIYYSNKFFVSSRFNWICLNEIYCKGLGIE